MSGEPPISDQDDRRPLAATDDVALAAAAEAFVRQLEQTGVFADLKTVESRLAELTAGLAEVGDAAASRARDADNLAAHVLALEALVAVLLRHVPLDGREIDEQIARQAGAVAEDAESLALVRAIARQIVDGADR